MRRLFVVALLAVMTSPSAAVSLTVRDLGFATDVPGLGREVGWQGVSDVANTGELGWIAWYDYAPPLQRGMLTRVSAEGRLLDPVGRPAGGFSTRLIPDGNGVLLYWVENQGPERVLSLQRASNDGTISASRELVRVPYEPVNVGFDVAQGKSGMTLVGIGSHLTLLDGSTVVRQRTLDGWGQPTLIAAIDEGWVVTWIASGGFAMWVALDDELEPIGPAGGSAVTDGASAIDVLSEGSTFLYAASGEIGLNVWRIDPRRGEVARIVDLDIAFVNPILIGLSNTRSLLAWTVNGNIEGAEIANDSVGQAFVILEDAGFGFTMNAWRGSLLLADSRGGCIRGLCEFDVYASLRTTEGTSSARVSAAAARQTSPSIVIDGEAASAAWLQYDDGVFGSAGVVAWGTRGDGGRFDVRTLSAAKPLASPSIGAFEGHRILVWSTISLDTLAPVLEGYVLDETGVPKVALEFPIGLEPQHLIVSGGPSGWLITWFEWSEGGRLAGLRVGFDGRAMGEPFGIGPAQGLQFDASADLARDSFVLTWLDRSGETGPYRLRTARVTASGIVVPGSDLESSTSFLVDPSVSCGRDLCLVAWSQVVEGESDHAVVGRMIDPVGLTPASQPFTIADTPSVESSPVVRFFDDGWVVTWSERDASSTDSIIRTVRLEGAHVIPPSSTTVGEASRVDAQNHALACGDSSCFSLQSLVVDDATRGRTVQLKLHRITESRQRGVRRDP